MVGATGSGASSRRGGDGGGGDGISCRLTVSSSSSSLASSMMTFGFFLGLGGISKKGLKLDLLFRLLFFGLRRVEPPRPPNGPLLFLQSSVVSVPLSDSTEKNNSRFDTIRISGHQRVNDVQGLAVRAKTLSL